MKHHQILVTDLQYLKEDWPRWKLVVFLLGFVTLFFLSGL